MSWLERFVEFVRRRGRRVVWLEPIDDRRVDSGAHDGDPLFEPSPDDVYASHDAWKHPPPLAEEE